MQVKRWPALAVLMAHLVAGCASSDIVQEGPDSYVIYREGGTGFSGTGRLKMEAIREANAYCRDMGKRFRVTRSSETPGGTLGRYPGAEVGFMCLDAGDPELTRPKFEPGADAVIEVRKPSRD